MKEKLKNKIKMKRYDLTPQERNNFCVCSVLQAIFRRYEIGYSQKQIALELNPSEKGFFVDDLRFSEFMMRNGFSYTFFRHNETPFNEPDTLLEEMNSNNGIIGINDHTFLLSRFIYPQLEMIDPEYGKPLNKNLQEILKDMRNLDGGFGLIKHIKGGQLYLRI